ncbi:CaiB/BaiF CoA transferase family protein [Cohnella boryungensis]|uniref:CaiB/BaiF CoA transferase family protein n=1 Tax=Cohnella boryungensis TaxID=768479 RepID=A0ABV8SAI2_9BACL
MSRADKPLAGLTVVDFSQFLSGPYAGLRLADLGARVIKIENPSGGDLCRRLYISNVEIEGDSSLFHAINRNKESFCVDLKDERGKEALARLLEKADVVIQNFRPGVIERLGFGYDAVRKINPSIVYGSISGYGTVGPLMGMPGQDLLVQSLTGLARSGMRDLGDGNHDSPLAYGLAVADMGAGALLAEGILAALVRRSVSGRGALVETSLLEATLDLMQEAFSDILVSSSEANEKGQVSAPAGIYRTMNGYLAIGRGCSQTRLIQAIGMEEEKKRTSDAVNQLECIEDVRQWIQAKLTSRSTADWLIALEQAGISCSEVMDWNGLLKHDGFRALEMNQTVQRSSGRTYRALRCPIRIDGRRLTSVTGSPRIGEHNEAILRELNTK